MPLHMIAYTSTYTGQPQDVDATLDAIVAVAQRANKAHNVTGVMFFLDSQFLQVIEGREADLRNLMRNIEADPRHTGVEYLIDTEVETRGFRRWSMDKVNLNRDMRFDAETLRDLSDSFSNNLLPRSDMLVFYYKALLAQNPAA